MLETIGDCNEACIDGKPKAAAKVAAGADIASPAFEIVAASKAPSTDDGDGAAAPADGVLHGADVTGKSGATGGTKGSGTLNIDMRSSGAS